MLFHGARLFFQDCVFTTSSVSVSSPFCLQANAQFTAAQLTRADHVRAYRESLGEVAVLKDVVVVATPDTEITTPDTAPDDVIPTPDAVVTAPDEPPAVAKEVIA